jgi:predicted small lipoprotein YifL
MFLTNFLSRTRLLPVGGLVLCAVALTACGRRGPLEPPPKAAAPAPNEIVAAPVGAQAPTLQQDQRVRFDDQGRPIVESVNQQPPSVPDAEDRKREFVLDPLLD